MQDTRQCSSRFRRSLIFSLQRRELFPRTIDIPGACLGDFFSVADLRPATAVGPGASMELYGEQRAMLTRQSASHPVGERDEEKRRPGDRVRTEAFIIAVPPRSGKSGLFAGRPSTQETASMSIFVGTASLFPSNVQQFPALAGKLVTCDCWHPILNPRSSSCSRLACRCARVKPIAPSCAERVPCKSHNSPSGQQGTFDKLAEIVDNWPKAWASAV